MRTSLLLVLISGSAFAADWPQWRGPNRDGVAPDSPALQRLAEPGAIEPAWVSESIPGAFESGWSCPVVSGGRVYLFTHQKKRKEGVKLGPPKFPWKEFEKSGMTREEYDAYEVNRRDEEEERAKADEFFEVLFCFEAATGKTLWKKQVPSVFTRLQQSGTAAVIDGKVFTHGGGRSARCYDAATGDVLWQTTIPISFRDEQTVSSIAVADGVAAVLCGHLVGFDAKTGAILWQGDSKRAGGSHSSPAVWTHAGKSYFIANVSGGATACFEPRTGREVWRVKSQAGLSSPVVVGDVLITYGSSRRSGLRAFRMKPEGAEELWIYSGVQDPGSSPVLVNDHIYVQGERRLACVDAKTGDEKWAVDLPHRDPRYTSLIAADGKVFYACEGVLCFAADPTGYRVVADLKMDDKGVLATAVEHRKRLKIDEIADEKQRENTWRNKVERQGPVQCTSPAIADGRLFLRLGRGVACYELSK